MSNPIVAVERLAKNPGEWLVLDAGVAEIDPTSRPKRYRAAADAYAGEGHVPGARFADLVAAFSDPDARFPFTRPDARRFQEAARAVGVSSASRIVVYDRSNGIWAARLWWLFRAYGHDAVFVLDGGLAAWTAAGLPLETGTPAFAPGDFVARERRGYFVDTPFVGDIVAGRRQGSLVNVLRPAVFSGEEQNYARPGHIPGSRNVPYADLIDPATNRFLARDRLEARFDGIPGPIVTYCGAGITAAGSALALALLGRTDVLVYDGSLNEWASDGRLPLATGAG